MTFETWLSNLPPVSLENNYLKILIYLIVIFTFLSSLVVFLTTRYYRKKDSPSLLDLDFETDIPTPSDIPPSERIAILNIEKAKSIAAQRALSDAHKKKEVSEAIFGRLSVRYASDVKKIEDEIEKTTREAEVSQLEEELKKMQGDYLSKIKGEEKIEVAPSTPATTPPPPPGTAPAPPMPAPTPITPTPAAPEPTKPKKEKRRGKKAAPTPPTPTTPAPTPTMPGKTAPPPPPGVTSTPPSSSVPSPPMPIAPPGAPATTPTIPAPTVPTPKPPGTGAPTPAVAPPATGEGEGDLFAKSTSIAALRKEMLKELDRLKKFMSEQQ
ncbi:hypothetical protein EU534_00195 [Candidatus Heimdallarchaeota archaeon]|nr:MAG: hypothetical protein EU534_00195 [Candidatus Heimdallarchaeota archaeon]